MGHSSWAGWLAVRAVLAGIATLAVGCGEAALSSEQADAETVGSTSQAIQAVDTWSSWYFDTNGGIKAFPAGVSPTSGPAVSSAWEGYCTSTCDVGHQLLRVVQMGNNNKFYRTFWTPNNGWLANWTVMSTQTFSRKPTMTSWDFPIVNQPQASISLVAGQSGGTVKTWKLGTSVTESSSWSTTNITGCVGNPALTQDQTGSNFGNLYLFCAMNDGLVHGWRIAKSSFGIGNHPTTWTSIANTQGTIEPQFSISAGQLSSGQINVFAQDPGPGQQYWINYFNISAGTWNGWLPIPYFPGNSGQVFSTGPTAVTRGVSNRVDVFGVLLTDNGGSAVTTPSNSFYSDSTGWVWNPNVPNTNTNANRVFGEIGATLFTYMTGGAPHKYIELFALDPATGKLKETVYRYPTNLGG